MTTNYEATKQWLKLVYNNFDRIIRNFIVDDYAATMFRIQLSVEQLQKSLLFSLGIQFRKTHEPSRILDSILNDENYKLDENVSENLEKLSFLAKRIEKEETATRYEIKKEGKIITPEEYYDRGKIIAFLGNLEEIIDLVIIYFKINPYLDQEVNKLRNFNIRIKELVKNE
jgi:HEPN domain-containing protein